MAAGFSCMNSLTVVQASQGLAKYIRDKHSDIASNGVVIGHDARHNSAKFAALAANAFIAMKIPVWYYSESSLTPSVPFGVTHLRAAAGVMITASHVCFLTIRAVTRAKRSDTDDLSTEPGARQRYALHSLYLGSDC
jgi:phosphoglucomutase